MTANWSYYCYDIVGSDLGDALRLASYDPLSNRGIHARYEGRMPIVGWIDGYHDPGAVGGSRLIDDAAYRPSETAVRTLVFYTAAAESDAYGTYHPLPAPVPLADLRPMIEQWLASVGREGCPPEKNCDGSSKRTFRVLHPSLVGVHAYGALVAVQPAWAYYHK